MNLPVGCVGWLVGWHDGCILGWHDGWPVGKSRNESQMNNQFKNNEISNNIHSCRH
jgi:hypothetical protein